MDMIKKISGIAKLELTEEESKAIGQDLEDIMNAFKFIDTIDVSNVKESFHPIELKDIFRNDTIEESLTNKQALQNTLNEEKGFFKSPRVMEK